MPECGYFYRNLHRHVRDTDQKIEKNLIRIVFIYCKLIEYLWRILDCWYSERNCLEALKKGI